MVYLRIVLGVSRYVHRKSEYGWVIIISHNVGRDQNESTKKLFFANFVDTVVYTL